MKRWNIAEMIAVGKKLFATIHKRKVHAHHNHEIHWMARARIVPHPRTIRKAREQIKQMVHDGFSTQSIRRYLHRFVLWWVNTSEIWTYDELLILYQETCRDKHLATFALDLLKQYAIKESYTATALSDCHRR